MTRLRVLALTLPVAGLVGACGSSTTPGTAVAGPPEAVAFDSCTQVSDTMITSLGLLPETKEPYTQKGPTVESGCAWKDSTTMARLLVDIGFKSAHIDTYLTNLGVSTTTELTIGGRRVVNFVTDTLGGGCNLAIDLGSAIAIVATSSASQTAGVPDPDSCPDAERIAAAISPVLP